MAARAALGQGSDPHRVPEHDLLRERRVWRAAGRAHVLRPRRRRADASRGCAPRRGAEGPVAVRSRGAPARGSRAPQPDPAPALRAGEDLAPRLDRRVGRAAAQAGGDAAAVGEHAGRPVLRELREAAADRPSTARPRCSAGATASRRRSTSRCRRRRGARSRSGSPIPRGRLPRSWRSTRATAASSRWSGAGTSARASSTSPRRRSASRARPSSRSSSRRGCSRASRRGRRSSRSRSRSRSATGPGTCPTTTTRTSGRSASTTPPRTPTTPSTRS